MTFAASFASGTPMALLTNGTVRDARGLTSSTNTFSSLTAYCTFIRPTTFNSRAMACVYSRMVSMTFLESVCGGRTIAASPECTPANSMCSRMPPMTMVPSPAFGNGRRRRCNPHPPRWRPREIYPRAPGAPARLRRQSACNAAARRRNKRFASRVRRVRRKAGPGPDSPASWRR